MPLSTILETEIRQYFHTQQTLLKVLETKSIQLWIYHEIIFALLPFKLLLIYLIYCKNLLISSNDLIKSQSFFPFMIQILTAWTSIDLYQFMTKTYKRHDVVKTSWEDSIKGWEEVVKILVCENFIFLLSNYYVDLVLRETKWKRHLTINLQ